MQRILDLSEDDIAGLRDTWRIVRLVVDLSETGTATRELGYDELGRLFHRWPGGVTAASHGILDLAAFHPSARSDLSHAEFEQLWQSAIEEEQFFTENDPYGDRFAKRLPWWACLGLIAIMVGIGYLIVVLVT